MFNLQKQSYRSCILRWKICVNKGKLMFIIAKMSFLSEIAKITDILFLSSATAVTRDKLVKIGITDVINCTLDVPELQEPGIVTTRIMIDDTPQAQLEKHFDKVADEINSKESAGGKVLVHCLAGMSRSATLCIAYLMKYKEMTLIDAHDLVKRKRPIIRPNTGFWKQLIEYEKRLFGCNTVKMVPSAIGFIPDIYKEETKNMI